MSWYDEFRAAARALGVAPDVIRSITREVKASGDDPSTSYGPPERFAQVVAEQQPRRYQPMSVATLAALSSGPIMGITAWQLAVWSISSPPVVHVGDIAWWLALVAVSVTVVAVGYGAARLTEMLIGLHVLVFGAGLLGLTLLPQPVFTASPQALGIAAAILMAGSIGWWHNENRRHGYTGRWHRIAPWALPLLALLHVGGILLV